MRQLFLRVGYRFARHVVLKMRVRGGRLLRGREAVVVVANHLGSFGPVTVMSSLPCRLYPWVTYEVTRIRSCARYLHKEFTEVALAFLGPRLRELASRMLGRICVSLMRLIRAVPVYKRSRLIRRTMDDSLELLEAGHNVLVFPEDPDRPLDDVFCEFYSGFVHLARELFRRTRRRLTFVPVAVHPTARVVQVGRPVRYDPSGSFGAEKRRLTTVLQQQVMSMYGALDADCPPAHGRRARGAAQRDYAGGAAQRVAAR